MVLMRRTALQRLRARLGAQDLAALATAGGENRAAATGGHAGAEAVRLRTLPDVRLVSSLHCSSLSCPSVLGQSPTIICACSARVNDVRELQPPCRSARD